jgi:hypothetical protein
MGMKCTLFLMFTVELHLPVFCLYNNPMYKDQCIPAKHCAIENVCYCSDLFDGWMNGGIEKNRLKTYSDSAYCYKNGRDCECEDCGYWGASSDQCQEERCDDVNGVEESGQCYHIDPITKAKRKSGRGWQFNCYRVRTECDTNICNYGEQLVGCMRASPGSCKKCPAQNGLVDTFFPVRGFCKKQSCAKAGAGEFVAKVCTETADSVIATCGSHPGNIQYIVPRQDGKDTYYCPKGGLVLPLPEHSIQANNYTSFKCIDGFYLSGSACLTCPTGHACKHGKKYICPTHYYSSTYAMSYCTRCSTMDDCHKVSKWNSPIRCKQGSTANGGCVACGGCSWDPMQGLSCVTESYEMYGLGPRCEPADVESVVAVCSKS